MIVSLSEISLSTLSIRKSEKLFDFFNYFVFVLYFVSVNNFFFHKMAFFQPFKCICFPVFFLTAVSAYVEAFDEIVSGPVAQYVSLSQQIGGDVQKHVSHSFRCKIIQNESVK